MNEVSRMSVKRFGLACLVFFLLVVAVCTGVELPNPVSVEVNKRDGLHILTLVNTSPVPISYKFDFTFVNARLDGPKTLLFVVPPKGSVKGPRVRRVDDSGAWRWNYNSTYRIGDYRVKETDYVYTLPWRPGESYLVNQGFHGYLSHKGQDAYAADFDLPEGTPVTAARAGLVVSLENESNIGGPDESFREHANYVMLAHTDGTLTRYYHLARRTVAVDVGDWVEVGTVLGRSGNTGFSTAPHLHFDVCRPTATLELQTLSFRILNRGEPALPVQDMMYGH